MQFLIDNSSSFWHDGNRSSPLSKNLFLNFCMFLPYFLKQSLISSFLCQILFYYGSSAYNDIAVLFVYLYYFNTDCLTHECFQIDNSYDVGLRTRHKCFHSEDIHNGTSLCTTLYVGFYRFVVVKGFINLVPGFCSSCFPM